MTKIALLILLLGMDAPAPAASIATASRGIPASRGGDRDGVYYYLLDAHVDATAIDAYDIGCD